MSPEAVSELYADVAQTEYFSKLIAFMVLAILLSPSFRYGQAMAKTMSAACSLACLCLRVCTLPPPSHATVWCSARWCSLEGRAKLWCSPTVGQL